MDSDPPGSISSRRGCPLFGVVEGNYVLVISHLLEDIFEVADRVMVLRHGRKVGDLPIGGKSLADVRDEVVACIVGAVDDFAPTQ